MECKLVLWKGDHALSTAFNDHHIIKITCSYFSFQCGCRSQWASWFNSIPPWSHIVVRWNRSLHGILWCEWCSSSLVPQHVRWILLYLVLKGSYCTCTFILLRAHAYDAFTKPSYPVLCQYSVLFRWVFAVQLETICYPIHKQSSHYSFHFYPCCFSIFVRCNVNWVIDRCSCID